MSRLSTTRLMTHFWATVSQTAPGSTGRRNELRGLNFSNLSPPPVAPGCQAAEMRALKNTERSVPLCFVFGVTQCVYMHTNYTNVIRNNWFVIRVMQYADCWSCHINHIRVLLHTHFGKISAMIHIFAKHVFFCLKFFFFPSFFFFKKISHRSTSTPSPLLKNSGGCSPAHHRCVLKVDCWEGRVQQDGSNVT